MNQINLLVESALSPTLLHERSKIITLNQSCRALKGGDTLSELGLEVWFKQFFVADVMLNNFLEAIENYSTFEGMLQTFSTGTQINWLVKTMPLALKKDQKTQQITWLLDDSGKSLRASYWDLYIKMNEALLMIKNTLDERSQALQRAEIAETRALFLSSLAEINPLPIMRLNQKKEVVYANKPASDMLSRWKTTYQLDLPAELTDKINAIFATNHNDTYEYAYDEHIFLFNLSKINLNEDFIDIFAVDITERKKMEKENVEKNALLEHAGRLTALGEMATGVAHELNQPLSIIKTNLQSLEFLAENGLSKQDTTEIVASSLKQIDRASVIISHMRTFSRLKIPRVEPIDLSTPIESALNMFNEQFRLHNIEIIKHIEKNIPLFKMEAQQMEQILVNLLSNARYAVEAAAEENANKNYKMQIDVHLKYLSKEHQILIQVTDNGIGMTKDVLKSCFNPFFTTKPIGEGTGLGLSIIHSAVTNLHGTIQVESDPGKGTIINILLPATADELIVEALNK
ncbi:MAG: GHKL domain-containing protein [Gammaproteobacteria bacterium]|nr:GHKL domain-containing protein [Gammaproteobacteria bacterium]